MRKSLVVFLPVFATAVTIACGSGSNRQLQSIAVNTTSNSGEITFIATGTYSAPPTTVSPLPVSWGLDGGTGQYTLTTQPFEIACNASGGPVEAIAPADPNAPSSGSIASTKMVSASASDLCH